MALRFPEPVYHDSTSRMDVSLSVFPGSLQELLNRMCVHHGVAHVLSCEEYLGNV